MKTLNLAKKLSLLLLTTCLSLSLAVPSPALAAPRGDPGSYPSPAYDPSAPVTGERTRPQAPVPGDRARPQPTARSQHGAWALYFARAGWRFGR
jgi:hypothetical protein